VAAEGTAHKAQPLTRFAVPLLLDTRNTVIVENVVALRLLIGGVDDRIGDNNLRH